MRLVAKAMPSTGGSAMVLSSECVVGVRRLVRHLADDPWPEPFGRSNGLIGTLELDFGKPERGPVEELVDLPDESPVGNHIAALLDSTPSRERPDGKKELLARRLLDLDAFDPDARLEGSNVLHGAGPANAPDSLPDLCSGDVALVDLHRLGVGDNGRKTAQQEFPFDFEGHEAIA